MSYSCCLCECTISPCLLPLCEGRFGPLGKMKQRSQRRSGKVFLCLRQIHTLPYFCTCASDRYILFYTFVPVPQTDTFSSVLLLLCLTQIRTLPYFCHCASDRYILFRTFVTVPDTDTHSSVLLLLCLRQIHTLLYFCNCV